MKSITLKEQDWNDLATVLSDSIKQDSKNIEFKNIINVHKVVSQINTENKDYFEKNSAIAKQRDELISVARTKIDAKREELQKKYKKDEKKVNEGVSPIITELQEQITNEIVPQFEELNKDTKDLTIEIAEDNHTSLIAVFEGFAKDKYVNVDAMVRVYNALTE